MDAISKLLAELPKQTLILIIGDAYTLPFHVGIEIIKRYFNNFRWYFVVEGLVRRYLSIIRNHFNIAKSDIEFIGDLCGGLRELSRIINNEGNLVYVVMNSSAKCVNDYIDMLVKRPLDIGSIIVIQVDEDLSKPFTYLADLIIRLKVVEDVNSLKTISRVAKLITTGVHGSELVLNYNVTTTGIAFEEFLRI